MKSRSRTVKSCEKIRMFDEYQKAKRTYESEFKFQKKALKIEIRKKFKRE